MILKKKEQKSFGRVVINECIKRFCNIIQRAGFKVGIYASLDWFRTLIDIDYLKKNNIYIWCAQWNSSLTANFDVDIWQYSNRDLGYDSNILINEKLLKVVDNVENSVDNLKAMAVDTILGKYGNGSERKKALGKNYSYVQDIVNSLVKILK